MSLLVMSLGDRFCVSRKGRTGGGAKDAKYMIISGFGYRKALVGSGWAISCSVNYWA